MNLETVKLQEISPDPANVRKHSDRNIEAIIASLRAFGQQKPIVVDQRGIILAGNGTYEAARRLGWENIQITRTALSGPLATAYAIADNRTAELAEWDSENLALQLQSFRDANLDTAIAGFDEQETNDLLDEFLKDVDGSGTEQIGNREDADYNYTSRIIAPVYEPTGECPEVRELTSREKTQELIDEIKASTVPADVKNFLITAAERHCVFHFARIAEFYAHSNKDVQNLMEKSGLVIIDFDKAIEAGFVKLSERLGAIAELEGYTTSDFAE